LISLFCNCEERYVKLLEIMMQFSELNLKQTEAIHAMKVSVERIEKHIRQECRKKYGRQERDS
jgi:hypothetical protein